MTQLAGAHPARRNWERLQRFEDLDVLWVVRRKSVTSGADEGPIFYDTNRRTLQFTFPLACDAMIQLDELDPRIHPCSLLFSQLAVMLPAEPT